MSEELTNRLIVALDRVSSLGQRIEFNSKILEDIRKDLDRLIETRGEDAVAIAKLEADVEHLKEALKERDAAEVKKSVGLAAAVTTLSGILAKLVSSGAQ